MRKRNIALAVTGTVFVLGIAAFLVYDPTLRYHDADERIDHVMATEMPENMRITEQRSEPAVPSKNPFWVRYHPRNFKRPQLGLSGTDDGSWAYLIECQRGNIRCYSHFFRGYTSAFTILYSASTEADAKLLAAKLRDAFPLLPVTIQESATLTIGNPAKN